MPELLGMLAVTYLVLGHQDPCTPSQLSRQAEVVLVRLCRYPRNQPVQRRRKYQTVGKQNTRQAFHKSDGLKLTQSIAHHSYRCVERRGAPLIAPSYCRRRAKHESTPDKLTPGVATRNCFGLFPCCTYGRLDIPFFVGRVEAPRGGK